MFFKPYMGQHHIIYLGCCPHILISERCGQNTRCSWFFPRCRLKTRGDRAFAVALLWKSQPVIIRTAQSVEEFKYLFKIPLFFTGFYYKLSLTFVFYFVPIYCISLCFYCVRIFFILFYIVFYASLVNRSQG